MGINKKKYYLKEDIRDYIFERNNCNYDKKIEDLTNTIINNISLRKKNCYIILNDETQLEMRLGNYLTYLIIFEPFHVFKEDIPTSIIPNVCEIKKIEKYFDWCIKHFKIENNQVNDDYSIGEILVNIIDRLNYITCEMTKSYGPTIDLKTFIDLADRNEEFHQILYEPWKNTKTNENFNAKDIVQYTNDTIKKIEQIILEDTDNNFKKFISSGSGINMKQLGQVFGFIGLKPDLKEKIIPKIIDTNFCMGLQDISHFYVNSIGCLKALITSKIQTKNSGYFTRKLEILLNDEFIADIDDCGTKHLMPLEIKNKRYLNHLNNRYYSMKPNGSNLKKFDIDDDNEHLVGKKIYLRDPTMCSCKKGICKKCYGDLWKQNYEMNIGVIACLILTNAFTQKALGTKHLLQANVLKKTFSPTFLKYFDIDLDKIIIKDKFINDICLAFDPDIERNEETDSEEYQAFSFSIIDGDEKIDIDENICFLINTEINSILKSDYNKEIEKYIVKGKKIKDLEYVFSYSIDNNGLSRPMLMTKELIERNGFIKEHDIFELFNKFIELMDESDSNIDYIHIGVILKNLMEVTNGREELNKNDLPEIIIYSLPDAIQHSSESVSKPLIFERIKDQLLTDKYGTLNKSGYSSYDELMK